MNQSERQLFCSTCGGVIDERHKALLRLAASPFKECPGHAGQTEKRDDNLGEVWSEGVTNTKQAEPITLESLIETIERLRKEYPDIGKHHCSRFISAQKYFPAKQGTRYMCIECCKMYVVLDCVFEEIARKQDERPPDLNSVALLRWNGEPMDG